MEQKCIWCIVLEAEFQVKGSHLVRAFLVCCDVGRECGRGMGDEYILSTGLRQGTSPSLRAELSWPNFSILGIKLRALCTLGKLYAAEPLPSP